MMWPFDKKPDIREDMHRAPYVPRTFKTESRPYDREAFRRAIIDNRSNRKSGNGPEYWDSICAIVEKHLNVHPSI